MASSSSPRSPPPSPATVRAAALLEGIQFGAAHGPNYDQVWTVDTKSWKAVRLALADRRPMNLKFVTGDEPEEEVLTVAQIAAVTSILDAGGCGVMAYFHDSFYSPADPERDVQRLEPILANERLHLCRFYGHLDGPAIAMLPRTINQCGLAIGSAVDAETLHNTLPWLSLGHFYVSVSSSVAVEDLKPLLIGLEDPEIVQTTTRVGLVFPKVTDASVDFVRAAIEALMPGLGVHWLDFPKCELSADGTRHLVQRLKDVDIRESVTMETGDTWRPDAVQKASLATEYNTGVQAQGRSPRSSDTEWNFA